MKIFSTFDPEIVKLCQLHCGFQPLVYTIYNRKVSFINKLLFCDNTLLMCLHELNGTDELQDIAFNFNATPTVFQQKYSSIMRAHFLGSF